MDFGGIGFGELLLILVIALIIFGPHRLPEIARKMGETVRHFTQATADLNRRIEEETRDDVNELKETARELSDDITAEAKRIDKEIKEDIPSGPQAAPRNLQAPEQEARQTGEDREDRS